MSVHTKKHLIRVTVADKEFNIPSSDANAILSLVKTAEKACAMDASIAWREVYHENFGTHPEWAICLKGARRKANMSQRELSAKTEISITTISKYENAEREISESQAKKLSKALKTDYRVFLTR